MARQDLYRGAWSVDAGPPVASALSPNPARRQNLPIPRAGEGGRPVIVIVGLMLEARIAYGENAIVVCHDKVRGLPDLLHAAVAAGCGGIVSFGLAGGLAPEHRAGDWVIASGVIDEEGEFIPTSARWTTAAARWSATRTAISICGRGSTTNRPSSLSRVKPTGSKL
jgi:hypothetical protein